MSLDSPAVVMTRLQEIERDLAERQNELEDTAREWYTLARDRGVKEATVYAETDDTPTGKRIAAKGASAGIGVEEEARWEALKRVVDVLQTRASIGQSLLRAMGRT